MPRAADAPRKKLVASRSAVCTFTSEQLRCSVDFLPKRINDGVVREIPSRMAGDFEWNTVHSDMAEKEGFGFTLFKALNKFQKQCKIPAFT